MTTLSSNPLIIRSEMEFEILKLILLRERYIKQLQTLISTRKVKGKRIVDLSSLGKIEILRNITVEIVETIIEWEFNQIGYPNSIYPFLWNGSDYLLKLISDIKFLDEYSDICNSLSFQPSLNPFFVPMEILDDNFTMTTDSYVIFGKRPILSFDINIQTLNKKLIKSPYITPIINDPDIIPSLSANYKIKKFIKASKVAENISKKIREDQENISKDPYETYLLASFVGRIRTCWQYLCIRHPQLYDKYRHSHHPVPDHQVTDITTTFHATNIVDSNSDRIQRENGSIISSEYKMDSYNKYMRAKALNKEDRSQFNISDPHIWTPHDIQLQKIVHKRGGELSLLTAVGTKGKIKPPTRKSRLERLENDIIYSLQECECLEMFLEDLSIRRMTLTDRFTSSPSTSSDTIESYQITQDLLRKNKLHLSLLQRQYKTYETISYGKIVTDRKKRLKMKLLRDGETLEVDEKVSQHLEHTMAYRIQKLVRQKLARIFRSKLFVKYREAVIKIQTLWRKYISTRVLTTRSYEVQLAIFIQKLYRRRKARGILRELRINKRILDAVISIQRIFRGYNGRRRFSLKKEFLQNIKEATKMVSSFELIPAHIDALAEEIENFMADYTLIISLNVLSILRGIFYLLNGDENAENLMIYNSGVLRILPVYARNLSWHSALLILRRKCRLLRRLRSLVKSVATPNPMILQFSNDCVNHLLSIDNITITTLHITSDSIHSVESTLFGIKSPLAKECLVKLSLYCRYMIRIHQLQHYFPDYFIVSNENWFKAILQYQKTNEELKIELNSFNICRSQLEEKRHSCLRLGKKLGPVLHALKKIKEDIHKTISKQLQAENKLSKYISDLEESEQKKLTIYQNLERTKSLSVEISKKELDEYQIFLTSNNVKAMPSTLKELQAIVDRNALSLIECQAEIQGMELDMVRKKELRKLCNMISTKKIYKLSSEYGILLSNLIILQQIWNNFVEEIGGAQYGDDLVGEKLLYYQNLKRSINNMMIIRNKYLEEIQSKIKIEFQNFDKVVLDTKKSLLSGSWDRPTPVELQAEEYENIELARVDANRLFSLAQYHPTTSSDYKFTIPESIIPYQPLLLLLDITLPEITKHLIIKKFEKLKFIHCTYSIFTSDVLDRLQKIFDQSYHAILLVDRGIDMISFTHYHSVLKIILNGLAIKPKCLSINHQFRFEPWHTRYHVNLFSITIPTTLNRSSGNNNDNSSNSNNNNSRSDITTISYLELPSLASSPKDCKLLLGKLRHIATLYRQLLSMSSKYDENYYHTAFYAPSSFRTDFQTDFQNLIYEIESLIERNHSLNQQQVSDVYISRQSSTMLSKSKSLSFTQIQSIEPENRSFSNNSNKTSNNKIDYSNHPTAVLVATLTSLFGLWNPPIIAWSSKHVQIGANIFLELSLDKLCDYLFYESYPVCSKQTVYRIQQLRKMTDIWKEYLDKDIYQHPARSLLSNWCVCAMDFLESVGSLGGFANGSVLREHDDLIDISYDIQWYEDICSNDRLDELIGHLFGLCFSNSLIYDENSTAVTITYNQYIYTDRNHRITCEDQSNRHVRLYHYGNDIYIGVFNSSAGMELDDDGDDGDYNSKDSYMDKDRMVVTYVSTNDIMNTSYPTSVEMIQGKLQNFDNILLNSKRGDNKWADVISRWIRIDETGIENKLCLGRNRFVLLSKIGIVNGHHVRIEIIEQKYGEILFLVHGLLNKKNTFDQNNSNAIEYQLTNEVIKEIINYSDNIDERMKLEALDSFGIALCCGDRLQIRPSKPFVDFLRKTNLIYSNNYSNITNYNLKVSLRTKFGPGRYMGKHLTHIYGIVILITLYELSNDFDIYSLRIILYDITTSQSVEYRLSAIERVLLFDPSMDILPQIIDRIQLSYCKTTESTRTLLHIDRNNHKFIPPVDGGKKYVIYGDREYDIVKTSHSDHELYKSGYFDDINENSDGYRNSNEDDDDRSIDRLLLEQNIKGVLNGNTIIDSDKIRPRNSLTIDDDDINHHHHHHSTYMSEWDWAICLNRTPAYESEGNLTISIGLHMILKGFTVFVYDNRTLSEAYKFISYEETSKLFVDMSTYDLHRLQYTLNEDILSDLIEELLSYISIKIGRDGSINLILQGKSRKDNILITRLKYHAKYSTISDYKAIRKQKLYRKVMLKFFDLQLSYPPNRIISNKNPSSISSPSFHTSSNSINNMNMNRKRKYECIVRFDGKEIGEIYPSTSDSTTIFKSSSTNKDTAVLETKISHHKSFKRSFLEIDIYEQMYSEENVDKLLVGSVRIESNELESFFLSGQVQAFKINQSKKSNVQNRTMTMGTTMTMPLLGSIRIQGKYYRSDEPPQSFVNVDYVVDNNSNNNSKNITSSSNQIHTHLEMKSGSTTNLNTNVDDKSIAVSDRKGILSQASNRLGDSINWIQQKRSQSSINLPIQNQLNDQTITETLEPSNIQRSNSKGEVIIHRRLSVSSINEIKEKTRKNSFISLRFTNDIDTNQDINTNKFINQSNDHDVDKDIDKSIPLISDLEDEGIDVIDPSPLSSPKYDDIRSESQYDMSMNTPSVKSNNFLLSPETIPQNSNENDKEKVYGDDHHETDHNGDGSNGLIISNEYSINNNIGNTEDNTMTNSKSVIEKPRMFRFDSKRMSDRRLRKPLSFISIGIGSDISNSSKTSGKNTHRNSGKYNDRFSGKLSSKYSDKAFSYPNDTITKVISPPVSPTEKNRDVNMDISDQIKSAKHSAMMSSFLFSQKLLSSKQKQRNETNDQLFMKFDNDINNNLSDKSESNRSSRLSPKRSMMFKRMSSKWYLSPRVTISENMILPPSYHSSNIISKSKPSTPKNRNSNSNVYGASSMDSIDSMDSVDSVDSIAVKHYFHDVLESSNKDHDMDMDSLNEIDNQSLILLDESYTNLLNTTELVTSVVTDDTFVMNLDNNNNKKNSNNKPSVYRMKDHSSNHDNNNHNNIKYIEKRLDLYIMKGLGFPLPKDYETMKSFVFVIKLDGYEVSRSTCLSNIVDENNGKADFGNEYISIPIKLKQCSRSKNDNNDKNSNNGDGDSDTIYTLSESILEIELWNAFSTDSLHVLLATIDIRGDKLDQFVSGKGYSTHWFTIKFHRQTFQSIDEYNKYAFGNGLQHEDDHMIENTYGNKTKYDNMSADMVKKSDAGVSFANGLRRLTSALGRTNSQVMNKGISSFAIGKGISFMPPLPFTSNTQNNNINNNGSSGVNDNQSKGQDSPSLATRGSLSKLISKGISFSMNRSSFSRLQPKDDKNNNSNSNPISPSKMSLSKLSHSPSKYSVSPTKQSMMITTITSALSPSVSKLSPSVSRISPTQSRLSPSVSQVLLKPSKALVPFRTASGSFQAILSGSLKLLERSGSSKSSKSLRSLKGGLYSSNSMSTRAMTKNQKLLLSPLDRNHMGKIELQPILSNSDDPVIQTELEFHSISLRNLSYYDREGKEVLNVEGMVTLVVFFNKKLVRTMRSKPSLQDRIWPFSDRLKVTLYGKRKISECVLAIRLYEDDILKMHPTKRESISPIGVANITGNDLLKLLSSKNTNINQKKPVSKLIRATILANGSKGMASSFELHPPVHDSGDDSIVMFTTTFHGIVELQGKINKDDKDELVDSFTVPDPLIGNMKILSQCRSINDQMTRLLPIDMYESIVREVNNSIPEVIYLQVLSMKRIEGKENSSFDIWNKKRSDFYTKIFLNGQYMSRSKSVSLSNNELQWLEDAPHEITIPRGHFVKASRLAVNVYEDTDDKTTFLGKCYLEGKDLVSLISMIPKNRMEDRNLIERLSTCECRLYDINHHDLPYTLELRAWMEIPILDEYYPHRLAITTKSNNNNSDNNNHRHHNNSTSHVISKEIKRRRQQIELHLISARNIYMTNGDSINSNLNIPSMNGDATANAANAANATNVRSGSSMLNRTSGYMSPPDSPTFEFAKQSGKEHAYLVEVVWNKQRVYQFQGLSHSRQITLFVPIGYSPSQCILQIMIWLKGKCLGEVRFHGSSLMEFLSSTLRVQKKFNKESSIDDMAGVWYNLSNSNLIPLSQQISDTITISQAMIQLSGKLLKTQSDATFKDVIYPTVSLPSNNVSNRRILPVLITSTLDDKMTNWRYDYTTTIIHPTDNDDDIEEDNNNMSIDVVNKNTKKTTTATITTQNMLDKVDHTIQSTNLTHKRLNLSIPSHLESNISTKMNYPKSTRSNILSPQNNWKNVDMEGALSSPVQFSGVNWLLSPLFSPVQNNPSKNIFSGNGTANHENMRENNENASEQSLASSTVLSSESESNNSNSSNTGEMNGEEKNRGHGINNNNSNNNYRKLRSVVIEYPVIERGVEENISEEDRVCWRGYVKPKDFINNYSSHDSQAVFMPRSKRLIHIHTIKTSKVEADITYIQDSSTVVRDFGVTEHKLPIVVREVASHGPGLVRRHYRIDVSTNTGSKVGSVDLYDTYDDIRDVIGKKRLDLLDGPQDTWNLSKIFECIIEERMIIEMNPNYGITQSIGGNDMSTVTSGNTRKSKHHSRQFIINLIRESKDSVVNTNVNVNNNSSHVTKLTKNNNNDDNMNTHSVKLSSIVSPKSKLVSIVNPDLAYPSPAGSVSSEVTFMSLKSAKMTKTRTKPRPISPMKLSMTVPTKLSIKSLIPARSHQHSSTPSSIAHSITHSIATLSISQSIEQVGLSRLNWIRICTKVWRMGGKKFTVVVLFLSDDLLLVSNPNDFFDRYDTGLEGLRQVKVLFRCKDSKTEKVFDLEIDGYELSESMDRRYQLNLSTRYRREKFGYFIITYLMMKYTEDGISCNISLNLTSLRMGTKYLVHMKDENITNVDNTTTKSKILTQRSNVEESVTADDLLSVKSLDTFALSLSSTDIPTSEKKNTRFGRLNLAPLNILEGEENIL